jgi:gluconolactonase
MSTDTISPDYEVHDPRFAGLIVRHANLERLATGCRWSEGPAYFPAGRYLVWSDIPNDRMMRWDETDGSISVFRQSSQHANGNTIDRQGRLVTCEQATRRVTRTEHDGSISVLADTYGGKLLNSPNDVVVCSDDAVWFTDPTYGIDSDYEGYRAESAIGACHVYRLDPVNKTVSAVVTDRVRPNGLAFSPDESILYVSDTGASHVPGLPATLTAYTVAPEKQSVSEPRTFATCPEGMFDGFRCDAAGNVWTSAGRRVLCYAPDGALIGAIPIGEQVGNLCFGSLRRNRLFICAQTSVYSLYVKARAAV